MISKIINPIQKFFNSVTVIEKVLLIVFILYLVLLIPTPLHLMSYINSPFGLFAVCLFVFYFLFYCNPILGVLSLIVAFELLRRSAVMPIAKTSVEERTPSQKEKNKDLKNMNKSVKQRSLEEDIVDKLAPIGYSEDSQYIDSGFKPTNSEVGGASLI